MDVDFYEVLGVSPTASPKQVKAAYRRLVKAAHPDQGGSEALFRYVNEAWETLGDPVERARYDASRQRTESRPSGSSGPSRSSSGPKDSDSDASRRRSQRSSRLPPRRSEQPTLGSAVFDSVLVTIILLATCYVGSIIGPYFVVDSLGGTPLILGSFEPQYFLWTIFISHSLLAIIVSVYHNISRTMGKNSSTFWASELMFNNIFILCVAAILPALSIFGFGFILEFGSLWSEGIADYWDNLETTIVEPEDDVLPLYLWFASPSVLLLTWIKMFASESGKTLVALILSPVAILFAWIIWRIYFSDLFQAIFAPYSSFPPYWWLLLLIAVVLPSAIAWIVHDQE